MKGFYITTAIDYVNARPHLGHAYEKILADIIARWHRIRGEDVFFLTGTDENAQKNEQAAREAGIPVRDFVNRNSEFFREMCKDLGISNDDFIKTTQYRHVRVAREIFEKVLEKGDIYQGNYEGLYCEGCEAYVTEKELVDGKCPEHGKEPVMLKEPSWFFRMSKYARDVEKLLSKPGFVFPDSRRKEMLNRVREEGLKDLCVSRMARNQSESGRDEWGIDTPTDPDKGYHKIYVWFDALINYVSALEYPDGEKFRKYWPADVHMIGKGINWFHSVIWTSMLMSAGIKLPERIVVHGYITISGKKLSKTLCNIIDPIEIARKYTTDAMRYQLVRDIPLGEDGDFSEDALKARINGELVADLGNLVSRVAKLAGDYKGELKGRNVLGKELDLKALASHMDAFELHHALEDAWSFIRACNKYINDREPWKLGGKELGEVLYNLLEALRALSIVLEPFLPETAERMRKQLKVRPGTLKDVKFRPKATRPGKGEHLFQRVK